MQRKHFTKHGMCMNRSCKAKISGLLTSRITKLITTQHLGTTTTLPWKAETKVEEEKKMKPVVEESNLSSPELKVTDEQVKHPTSLKKDVVKVQNVCFVPVNNLP